MKYFYFNAFYNLFNSSYFMDVSITIMSSLLNMPTIIGSLPSPLFFYSTNNMTQLSVYSDINNPGQNNSNNAISNASKENNWNSSTNINSNCRNGVYSKSFDVNIAWTGICTY